MYSIVDKLWQIIQWMNAQHHRTIDYARNKIDSHLAVPFVTDILILVLEALCHDIKCNCLSMSSITSKSQVKWVATGN